MSDVTAVLAARPSQLHLSPCFLRGTVTPPASKSCAHRALLCAALADSQPMKPGQDEKSILSGLGEPSEDIQRTMDCMRQLTCSGDTLDCGESGTTLRLLVPLAAALGRQVVFTGRGRLGARPIREYADAFAGHGAQLVFPEREGWALPLRVTGRLQPGRYEIPGHLSSQYVSGLLLALPLLPDDSDVVLTSPLQSAPYVDLTIGIQQVFGVQIVTIPADPSMPFGGYRVRGGQLYCPARYEVESDYSHAAFWLAANRLGGDIQVSGLPEQSLQGDRAVVDWLARLAEREQRAEGTLVIDASQIPDLVPVLAATAACTPGDTRFVRAERLRLKESDRLAATADSLTSIGANIRVTDDGLLVTGQPLLRGGEARSWNDHRIAMSLAVAAARTREGVTLYDPWCVDKSYPGFFRDYVSLGGALS